MPGQQTLLSHITHHNVTLGKEELQQNILSKPAPIVAMQSKYVSELITFLLCDIIRYSLIHFLGQSTTAPSRNLPQAAPSLHLATTCSCPLPPSPLPNARPLARRAEPAWGGCPVGPVVYLTAPCCLAPPPSGFSCCRLDTGSSGSAAGCRHYSAATPGHDTEPAQPEVMPVMPCITRYRHLALHLSADRDKLV